MYVHFLSFCITFFRLFMMYHMLHIVVDQLVLNIKLKYYLVNKMYSHSAVYLYVGRATVIILQY